MQAETSIYLDYNATTPVAVECIDMVQTALATFGNPSSKHRFGEAAKVLTLKGREQVAAWLGASPAEIVFTGSATEANHLAIRSALALNPNRRHLVTSQVEHPSTLAFFRHLETAEGFQVCYLPVNRDGQLDMHQLEAAVTPSTALVSLMWANNETGVLFPVEEVAQLTKARGALFHTDAVQAAGRIPIHLKEQAAIDFLSVSGHKIYAPKGIAALFVRKGLRIPPLLHGHQERGRRGGTENVAGIAALGVAAELASQVGMASVTVLRDRLETELLMRLPGASVNGQSAPRVGNTSSLCLGRTEAEWVLDKLDRAGIHASAGSACTATGTEPSHVLMAMGLGAEAALSSVRFSLGRQTTSNEIDRVIECLPAIINTLEG